MKEEFWHAKWEENEIGFHQPDTNPHLRKHWPELNLPKGSKILVPLCGKSLDMLWLRDQGYEVVGVELSPLAVNAFFEENNLSPVIEQHDNYKSFNIEGLTLLQGNIFDLDKDELASFAGVFDRASLVALPPEMRQDYADMMKQGLSAETKILLVSMDYEQSEMSGPPFAVTFDEIKNLYSDSFEVDEKDAFNVLDANPRFRERGLSRMKEHVYYLHHQ